jgi:hypothetical protein
MVERMISDEHICIDDLKDIIAKAEKTPKNLTTQEQEMEGIIERIMNR